MRNIKICTTHFCNYFRRDGKLSETCPRIRQISWPIDVAIVVDAAFLFNIQIRSCSSGYVNVFQWNSEWFFSRRVKFDSGFNVMEVNEVYWHGPEIMSCFTGIRKRVMKWWKRPFWFTKKMSVTFSSNWVFPYQSGYSQFLISSRKIDTAAFASGIFIAWRIRINLYTRL